MNFQNNSIYKHLLGQLNLADIYVNQAFEHYHVRYAANDKIQEFVADSEDIPEELKQHEYIGLCDRTLGLQLPKGKTMEGGAIRSHYQHSGLFIASGGELFRGCVVFPNFDNSGQIASATGFRYGRVRDWQQSVIHWQKPALGELVALGINNVKEVAYGKACH
ncbi:hypothetical protein L1D59_20105 [Pseudoalteromonas piscicida]|uniref:hypothetical protein n=1 Tax=Pseudoalteromonas piscicida TaxID=43662 RepID=UPI001EFDC570|nr:hypothetical protein [Pseudoalteromonas piscicida]MCG9770905.1 hypothetical protein [Pseudoalteromonas piscicida]